MTNYEKQEVDPFDHLKISDNHCFLCGVDMGEDATEEHVFPKWLQRKYDLWNKTADLLNETSIHYKNLKVPCCASCNNIHLSKLEDEIKKASTKGYEAVKTLDEIKLYQWAAKLFYGLLRKEISLKFDRSDESSPAIFSEMDIKNFKMMHLIMQSIRRPIEFPSGQPFSVLVANMHNPAGLSAFDFRDNLLGNVIKVRLGEVGFIVSFEDGALNENSYGNYIRAVNGRKLHPIQFDELFAKVIYQNQLLENRLHFLLAMPIDETQPLKIDMVGYVKAGEWIQSEYAEFYFRLCKTWIEGNNLTWDDIFKPPNLVASWMEDSDGELMLLDGRGDRINV